MSSSVEVSARCSVALCACVLHALSGCLLLRTGECRVHDHWRVYSLPSLTGVIMHAPCPEASLLTSCALCVLTALWAEKRFFCAASLFGPAAAWSTVKRAALAWPRVSGGLRGFTRRLHLSCIAGWYRPVRLDFQKPSLVLSQWTGQVDWTFWDLRLGSLWLLCSFSTSLSFLVRFLVWECPNTTFHATLTTLDTARQPNPRTGPPDRPGRPRHPGGVRWSDPDVVCVPTLISLPLEYGLFCNSLSSLKLALSLGSPVELVAPVKKDRPLAAPRLRRSAGKRTPLSGYPGRAPVCPGTSTTGPVCMVLGVFFLWKPHVTRYTWHQTRTHKNARNSFCLRTFLTTRSRRYDDYKDSLSEIPFSSLCTQTRSHEVLLTGWLWAKQLSEQSAIHMTENGLWQSLTSEQDNKGQVAEMTKGWSPVTNTRHFRRRGCPCNSDCPELDDRHSECSRVGSDLPQSAYDFQSEHSRVSTEIHRQIFR